MDNLTIRIRHFMILIGIMTMCILTTGCSDDTPKGSSPISEEEIENLISQLDADFAEISKDYPETKSLLSWIGIQISEAFLKNLRKCTTISEAKRFVAQSKRNLTNQNIINLSPKVQKNLSELFDLGYASFDLWYHIYRIEAKYNQ